MPRPRTAAVVFVYGLLEPTGDAVRYVGVTVDPLRRLSQHGRVHKTTNTGLMSWLAALRSSGQRPRMVLLAVSDARRWRAVERRVIAFHRAQPYGNRLLNLDEGGEGDPVGQSRAARRRARARKNVPYRHRTWLEQDHASS